MAVIKNPPVSAGDSRDVGLIPGLGRSPGVRMAAHSSVLTWELPRTEDPGGLQLWSCESEMTERLSLHTYALVVLVWAFFHSERELF